MAIWDTPMIVHLKQLACEIDEDDLNITCLFLERIVTRGRQLTNLSIVNSTIDDLHFGFDDIRDGPYHSVIELKIDDSMFNCQFPMRGIARIWPCLRILRLPSYTAKAGDVLELTKNLPKLEYLQLEYIEVPDEITNALVEVAPAETDTIAYTPPAVLSLKFSTFISQLQDTEDNLNIERIAELANGGGQTCSS
ncbi:hypothetical protein FRC07_003159 [Ceratobasidium sp. 392]|nr:hypothetical protein FRC07_003159 [Ceratobasidium sp. 392]